MHAILSEDTRETTPTIFVIFGATGDLSLRKLLPALYDLYVKEKLPLRFEIVAFARRPFTDDSFRELSKSEIIKRKAENPKLEQFLKHIRYVQGLFDTIDSYDSLGKTLLLVDEKEFGTCSNKLFYLAVPPSFYESIITHLSSSGLTIPCGGEKGWTRVLVEKPFGNNLVAAERLDMLLGKLFKEEQIFRIDHYLAKETIQNILAFRFGNSIFEPLWSKDYVEKVEIILYERSSVEGRGSFYDAIGALRDVGQNHMLQMFALVAMEVPKELSAEAIRAARAHALESLKLFSKKEFSERVKRMRYKGFLQEPGVASDSRTETFFSITAESKLARWKNVPFILESGKAMSRQETRIQVFFKKDSLLIKKGDNEPVGNVLTFRIQPTEGIDISIAAKKPGLGTVVEERTLSFEYGNSGTEKMDAYEKVLLDAVRGDQTLFMSTEEMKAEWNFVMPILENWGTVPLGEYEKGSSPENLKSK